MLMGNLASASASCLSSRLPASLAEAFRAAASPSSPAPTPDSLGIGMRLCFVKMFRDAAIVP